MVNSVHYNTIVIYTILDDVVGKKRDSVWNTLIITRDSEVTYPLSSFLSENKIKTITSMAQILRLHSFEKCFRENNLENSVWRTGPSTYK